MWRFNWLVKRGWTPIIAHSYKVENYSIYWTSVILAKGVKRKKIRIDGNWDLSTLVDGKEGLLDAKDN